MTIPSGEHLPAPALGRDKFRIGSGPAEQWPAGATNWKSLEAAGNLAVNRLAAQRGRQQVGGGKVTARPGQFGRLGAEQ